MEVPPSEEKALNDGRGSEVSVAQPKVSLFPYRNKRRAIRPNNFSSAPNANTTDKVAESQLGDELDLMLESSGAPAEDSKDLDATHNGDDDVDYDKKKKTQGKKVQIMRTLMHMTLMGL